MQRASVVVVVVVVVAVGGEPLHCTGSRAGRVFAVWSCRGQAFAFLQLLEKWNGSRADFGRELSGGMAI